MPFAFALVGIVLLVAGVRGTSDDLLSLVKDDLTSTSTQSGFVYWILAIAALGALGYIDEVRPLSRALLLLVLVVLVLSEGKTTAGGGGLFTKFTDAIDTITERTAA
jgi:hypothetical protein